jgi:hypothetical protein
MTEIIEKDTYLSAYFTKLPQKRKLSWKRTCIKTSHGSQIKLLLAVHNSTIHSELTCLFTGHPQQASSYSHKTIIKQLQNIVLCNIIELGSGTAVSIWWPDSGLPHIHVFQAKFPGQLRGPTSALFSGYCNLSQEVKWYGRKADNTSASVEVKNEWSRTSPTLHTFLEWCLITGIS